MEAQMINLQLRLVQATAILLQLAQHISVKI